MTQPKEPQFRLSKSKFFNNSKPPPKQPEDLTNCKVKFEGVDVFLYAWQVQYILDTGLSLESENKILQSKLKKAEAEIKELNKYKWMYEELCK